MSREIKFRVWDDTPVKDGFNGIMITHEYVMESDYLKEGINGKYTIMQYTGLKDKNGVDIYEGDILEDYFNGNRVKIRYLANSFVGQYVSDKYFGGNLDNRNYLHWIIIGNIHENPELL